MYQIHQLIKCIDESTNECLDSTADGEQQTAAAAAAAADGGRPCWSWQNSEQGLPPFRRLNIGRLVDRCPASYHLPAFPRTLSRSSFFDSLWTSAVLSRRNLKLPPSVLVDAAAASILAQGRACLHPGTQASKRASEQASKRARAQEPKQPARLVAAPRKGPRRYGRPRIRASVASAVALKGFMRWSRQDGTRKHFNCRLEGHTTSLVS